MGHMLRNNIENYLVWGSSVVETGEAWTLAFRKRKWLQSWLSGHAGTRPSLQALLKDKQLISTKTNRCWNSSKQKHFKYLLTSGNVVDWGLRVIMRASSTREVCHKVVQEERGHPVLTELFHYTCEKTTIQFTFCFRQSLWKWRESGWN